MSHLLLLQALGVLVARERLDVDAVLGADPDGVQEIRVALVRRVLVERGPDLELVPLELGDVRREVGLGLEVCVEGGRAGGREREGEGGKARRRGREGEGGREREASVRKARAKSSERRTHP